MIHHWLVKSEASAYSWTDLIRDSQTAWTGVRNYQARNNLRAMKKGDLVLFYHSVTAPSVMGVAKVVQEAYPDPTAGDSDWSCVNLAPVEQLPAPVSLAQIMSEKSLSEMSLIKQSRLSVMAVTPEEYARILELGRSNESVFD